jgi:hypothetical protein
MTAAAEVRAWARRHAVPVSAEPDDRVRTGATGDDRDSEIGPTTLMRGPTLREVLASTARECPTTTALLLQLVPDEVNAVPHHDGATAAARARRGERCRGPAEYGQ